MAVTVRDWVTMTKFDIKHYHGPEEHLWQNGSSSPIPGENIYQLVKCYNLTRDELPQNNGFAIVGFRCDTGVKRSKGRIGAYDGPIAIRKALAPLAVKSHDLEIVDIGNIMCAGNDLDVAQHELGLCVDEILNANLRPVVFGGGHETAWGHFQGLAKHYDDIAIINFDAHFDLRELVDGHMGTSGTPFSQIAQFQKENNKEFHYNVIGLQESANSKVLYDKAISLNVDYVTAHNIHTHGPLHYIEWIDSIIEKHQHIYLTICLDVFAQSVAPGVSAPQIMGLYPQQVLPMLDRIIHSDKVVGFDIVECAPNHDHHNKTSRLAAQMVWQYLNS